MSEALAAYLFIGLGYGCILITVWIVAVVATAILGSKPFRGAYQGDLFDDELGVFLDE